MAALFFRSMIGVCRSLHQDLQIWGMVVSGTRWLSSLAGGRYHGAPEPDSLVIHSLGPGRLTIHLGRNRIATLAGGRIESRAFDLFESKWLQGVFSQVRNSFLNEAFGESSDAKYVPVDVDFVRMMTYNIVLRTLSVVRNGRHGGTLVIIDPDDEAMLRTPEAALRFKYLIADCPARRRYARMLTQAIIRLVKAGQPSSQTQRRMDGVSDAPGHRIKRHGRGFVRFRALSGGSDGRGWCAGRHPSPGPGRVRCRIDDSKRPGLKSVRHALDLEGEIWANEPLDNVGTRHRAVYRFCRGYPRCLAIVVSQDGSVQFVRNHNGAVTYWNQLSW